MNTRTIFGVGGLALALGAAVAHGGGLSWTVLVEHPASPTTRSLRGLALSAAEGDLYGGFIQGSSTAGFRHWTLANLPPEGTTAGFWNVTGGGNGLDSGSHQAEAVATDSRGFVYGASVKDSTGGDNARVFIFDAALGAPKIFSLADVSFFGTDGETVGDIAIREVDGTIQLYVTRFLSSSPWVERYVVGGTGVADATLTLDTTFSVDGQYAVPLGSYLRGIDVAADGTIFIASRENDRVYRVSADLTTVTSVFVARAMDVALHSNARAYVTRYDGASSEIVELFQYNLQPTGTVHTATGVFPHNDANTGYSALDIDADGRIYLADQIYQSNSDRVLVSSLLPQTVHVRFDPLQQNSFTGQTFFVDVVVASSGTSPQPFESLDAVLSWDPTRLKLLGSSQANAGTAFAVAGFPSDPDGVNMDFSDGDALFSADAPGGTPAVAPVGPATLVVTTLEFRALGPTPATTAALLPSIGAFGTTNVMNGGEDITGDFSGTAEVAIVDPVEITAKVELAGIWAASGPLLVDRCITFELRETGGTLTTVEVPMTFSSPGPGTAAAAYAAFLVEDLPYDCITARDALHTLRRTDDQFGPSGTGFAAEFMDRSSSGRDNDALISGDLNDDGAIDGADMAILIFELGTNYGTGDTDCGTAAPHADLNGDGVVDGLDLALFPAPSQDGFDEPGCPTSPFTAQPASGASGALGTTAPAHDTPRSGTAGRGL